MTDWSGTSLLALLEMEIYPPLLLMEVHFKCCLLHLFTCFLDLMPLAKEPCIVSGCHSRCSSKICTDDVQSIGIDLNVGARLTKPLK
jgi:hypothetical protein